MTSPTALKGHDRGLRVVETLAGLAPDTIAWLQVPLTPSRAAALAATVARTGIPAQKLILDLLDDVIFAREVA